MTHDTVEPFGVFLTVIVDHLYGLLVDLLVLGHPLVTVANQIAVRLEHLLLHVLELGERLLQVVHGVRVLLVLVELLVLVLVLQVAVAVAVGVLAMVLGLVLVLVVLLGVSVVRAQLLDAVGVAQCVESVLHVRVARRDHGDHAHARVVAYERVAQHLGERGAAEGHVRVAATQRSYALFERQQ